ncbi:MAG: hypothetical protein AAF417_00530 [Pseudomonadota bacterium]
MGTTRTWTTAAAVVAAVAIIGCTGEPELGEDVATPAATGAPELELSGEAVPIALDYAITGVPFVNQPIGIRIDVTSPLVDRPINLHYRSAEAGSLSFPESQALTAVLVPAGAAERRTQEFVVTPLREGRIYLVVSAELETAEGAVLRSMSIPIEASQNAAIEPATADDEA